MKTQLSAVNSNQHGGVRQERSGGTGENQDMARSSLGLHDLFMGEESTGVTLFQFRVVSLWEGGFARCVLGEAHLCHGKQVTERST